MKNTTEERIENAKKVSTENLIEIIKNNYPERFDQMLIDEEERKIYYYVKYKSIAFKREPFVLKFPLFTSWKKDFDDNINYYGEPTVLNDSLFLESILSNGFSPNLNEKYIDEKIPFNNLDFKTENGEISFQQPFYYIPTESEKHTCNNCNGEKYTVCTESECQGQHIYDCNNCNATGKVDCTNCGSSGWIDCRKCNKRGEYTCSSCNGKGEKKCYSCYGKGRNSNGEKCGKCSGRGYEKCSKCRNGMIRCEKCAGKGEYRCGDCSGRGEITCKKCDGKKRITCTVCYGDHLDNRYGKVDCEKCQTAGELAQISYVETTLYSNNDELFFTDKTEINAPNFGLEKIRSFANTNLKLETIYRNYNNENFENYDEHSLFCSTKALDNFGISKNNYPKLLQENIYYEAIPCVTFTYTHILSATQHKVSILSIDEQREVLFHSNPAEIAEEKDSFKDRYLELLNKAFSTKKYLDKIDRKHEMFLMLHVAKADGKIEEEEKRFLSQTITGLKGFTKKEKQELFGLMTSNTLPPLLPSNAYFSSVERSEDAKRKIVELVAKLDGEYEENEKQKLNEINSLIEQGHSIKPSKIANFFKTWQVSFPIILLIFLIIIFLIYTNIR
ncbi:TerB family tellurite resistance protein [Riemerella anatipestifer]|uniref:TerB family tellurite resistance protein n=1 Tax=Riemerella anatipestifer TaxID=34085 RepID=UPI0012ADFA2F|nr:TerB family tellurite resistance protein [Riemerella anatipestifer]USL95198.1 hypothetical protein D1J36_007910 [Riemerella anatipestifer]